MSIQPSQLAKPFLKWAGGKGQILEEIFSRLPKGLHSGRINSYVEPFIGGGAVFFSLAQQFDFENIFLGDINQELILTYKVVQNYPEELTKKLGDLEKKYLSKAEGGRKDFFYLQRDKFNSSHKFTNNHKNVADNIDRASLFIFLNRTCYNGLFRVNKSGGFNVPHGRYKNPTICDKDKIYNASTLLKSAKIKQGDFTLFDKSISKNSFVYFDPPYRPISPTSGFKSYSSSTFADDEQLRLASYFRQLDKRGAKVLLSNSDPKNVNQDDDFFDTAYKGFNIQRVMARRNISSKESTRGEISELLISNY